MKSEGYELSSRIRDYLLSTLPQLELTLQNNFWDSALWHGRITGYIAEAGVKSGFRIELARRFVVNTKFKTEIDYESFLKAYNALHKLNINNAMTSNEQYSTEIDVIYLDPNDNTAIALCEYENKREEIKENILKFRALVSSNPLKFKPKLCILGFYASSKDYLESVIKELIDYIRNWGCNESVSNTGEAVSKLKPLNCYWLIIGIYKAPAYTVNCIATILDPKAIEIDERETNIGKTVH